MVVAPSVDKHLLIVQLNIPHSFDVAGSLPSMMYDLKFRLMNRAPSRAHAQREISIFAIGELHIGSEQGVFSRKRGRDTEAGAFDVFKVGAYIAVETWIDADNATTA